MDCIVRFPMNLLFAGIPTMLWPNLPDLSLFHFLFLLTGFSIVSPPGKACFTCISTFCKVNFTSIISDKLCDVKLALHLFYKKITNRLCLII